MSRFSSGILNSGMSASRAFHLIGSRRPGPEGGFYRRIAAACGVRGPGLELLQFLGIGSETLHLAAQPGQFKGLVIHAVRILVNGRQPADGVVTLALEPADFSGERSLLLLQRLNALAQLRGMAGLVDSCSSQDGDGEVTRVFCRVVIAMVLVAAMRVVVETEAPARARRWKSPPPGRSAPHEPRWRR